MFPGMDGINSGESVETKKKTERMNYMITNFSENMASNAYFQSLPAWVQETIEQTAITLHSEEELRQCAEQLMRDEK